MTSSNENKMNHAQALQPYSIQRWLILVAVMLATLPIVLDMTILHIVVPRLTQAIGASTTEVLWIIDIYPLLMAGLLVPMGTLADRVGNWRILQIGLMTFTLASVLAAYSPNATTLIVARAFLALGGAMIMPCVLGIICRNFEDEGERGVALGLWSMVGATGSAIGPLIGGFLLEHFWWGSVFLINVVVMLVVAPICYFILPRKEEATQGKWAFDQAIVFIIGIISVVYGIKTISTTQPTIFALLTLFVGVAMLTIFGREQLRSSEAMLDLSLLSHPVIIAGITMTIVSMGVMAGVQLVLAQESLYVLDKTPLEAGIVMLPLMVGVGIGGALGGFISKAFGLRMLAVSSLCISACVLFILARSDFGSSIILVPAMLSILGLMLSASLTASSIAIMGSVETSKGGAAGSLEATGFELGTGLGIAFFGVGISLLFKHTLKLPVGLNAEQTEQASRSIGDAYLVATQLTIEQSGMLIEASKQAFIATHTLLFSSAGVLLSILSIAVYILLGGSQRNGKK